MKKKFFGIFTAVFFGLAAAGAILATAWMLEKLPPPFEMDLKLPKNAEVFSYYQLTPGTFKVKIPLNELLQRAESLSTKTLVSWSKTGNIEYWLPAQNFFYYSHSEMKPETRTAWGWRYGINTYRTELKGTRLIFYPGHFFAPVMYLLSLMSGLVGGALLLFLHELRRRT